MSRRGRHVHRRHYKRFPRRVALMVADLAIHHCVGVRMQAGESHLFLYSEDGARPFKVSASRPAEDSLRYLNKWAVEHGYWEEGGAP